MQAFTPNPKTRVILEIVVPSEKEHTPEQWRKDATICPPNWPTDYSLLRAWYHRTGLWDYVKQARTAEIGRGTRGKVKFKGVSASLESKGIRLGTGPEISQIYYNVGPPS